jgi:hypothetical protein
VGTALDEINGLAEAREVKGNAGEND